RCVYLHKKRPKKPCNSAAFSLECRPRSKSPERKEHEFAGRAESASREDLPALRQGHRFPRSADRAPHRADQRADRPLQVARQGFPLAPRPPEDGEPAPQAAGLPEAQRRRQVPLGDRPPRSAQVAPRASFHFECRSKRRSSTDERFLFASPT